MDVSPQQMDVKARIFKVLIGGRESANRLETLLQEMVSSSKATISKSSFSEEVVALANEVLSSFSKAISFLDADGMLLRAPLHLASEHTSKKRKIQQPRKSGYRRRAHPYTCTRILSETIEDGHTWRKYGQKDIYCSKFPRSYFRCSHKYDRDCQATRQVQQSEDDPSMFVITYMGEHTCMDTTTKSRDQSSPCIINFGSNTCTANDQQQKPFPSSVPNSPKQECDEEVLSNLSPTISSTEPIFPELPDLEVSASMAHLTGGALDHCDVTSGFHSSACGFNMEFIPEALEFDDVFSFTQGELYY